MPEFHGESTRVLENQFVRLEYLANSARIVRFARTGGENLFADLGLTPLATPYGDFYFRGGHRLWHSPEAMPRTYIPDNDGAQINEIQNGVRIQMPREPGTHLSKAIEISLNPDQPQVIVRHELHNEGMLATEFAPWALTMFRLGGIAILPQPNANIDEAGLLPNRQLALWPYSHINDPRLTLRDDFILVQAAAHSPALKLGYFNPHGWSAYWLDGTLFVKRYDARPDARHPDGGCNTESYCNDQFIELESLGPLATVQPGEVASHTELWELHDTLNTTFIPEEIRTLIQHMN